MQTSLIVLLALWSETVPERMWLRVFHSMMCVYATYVARGVLRDDTYEYEGVLVKALFMISTARI